MSAQQLITEHLDIWTGAVTQKSSSGRGSNGKIELTGIKKLRELILELAVSGRLVSQSPDNTSFKEYLSQLRRDHTPIKARGRNTVSGDVSKDEQPFEIPKTWTWTRIGEIVEVLDSQRKPITKALRKAGPYPYYGASGIVDYIDGYLFDEWLVLVGEDGAKWDKGEATAFSISGKAWVNNHAHVLRPRKEAVSNDYLVYFLTAADLNPYITGMTVPKLNQARLRAIPVATPCLDEQHRIVQKVDELMALCDRLEQQTNDQLEAHETLVDTLLGTLTHSENATGLADNWARLSVHFDTLFTTEQSIDKLRKSILELAVRGKLVPQSSESNSFRELLLQLRDEHTPIKKRGRKTVSGKISDDEKPFNIPKSWTWTRLGEIVDVLDNQRKPITKAARRPGPYPYYGASGIVDYIDGYLFDESLVLVGEDGAKWGKGEATAFSISGKAWVNNHAHVLRPRREAVNDEYLVCFLTASDLNSFITGMTVPKLNQARLASIPIATPCLEEQRRIVQKVDELMTLCDKLRERLKQANDTRCALAEAVTKQAMN